MKLQVVSNRKLYIQIADQIRDQILTGEVEPGRQLPSERDLAHSLGVSRPTVREALIALEVAGLVEVRVGVGAFVRLPDTGDSLPEMSRSPLEIMNVRRMLEPEAAALASTQIGDAAKLRLTGVLETMREEARNEHWSSESDRALHMFVADATDNAVLREMLDMLWTMREEAVDSRFHQHLADIRDVREHILGDHERIVAAILAGNPDAARAAMTAHLDFVSGAMLETWE